MFLFKKKGLYLKLKNRLTVETVFSFIYESTPKSLRLFIFNSVTPGRDGLNFSKMH